MSCLFCKIIAGEIPSSPVYQDDHVFVIRDISPQAPTHCLILPKKHISTINDLAVEDTELVGHMIQTAKKIAELENITESGYRLVFNTNEHAGQSVFHIHLHVLGGRTMHWPPG